ncbi:MAG: DUF1622 domain-containing protein [Candidatus Sumerlaeia bacterium]
MDNVIEAFKTFVVYTNDIIVHLCHFLAIGVIIIGVSKAVIIYLADMFTRHKAFEAMQESRMEIGHAFSLALGLLIGASILKTTLAPSWNDIGQLGAIIALRTGLNYLLLKDIRKTMQEKKTEQENMNITMQR